MIWKLLVYALAGYVVLIAIVFVLQRKMLCLPDGGPLSAEQAAAEGLLHWPSLENFRGYVGQGTPADTKDMVGASPSSWPSTMRLFPRGTGRSFSKP